ncbi:MAG: DNA polymerase I [Lachnospiraceae bacterium]|nr:DNA polymerase I [Lachnospiraceae bacterium]
MSEKLLMIDGHSIINRAFYGMPDLKNSAGVHTGAILGFINIVQKIIDSEKPDYLAVAFDTSAPTFRHEMFEAYKGTRKPTPEDLKAQVPLLQSLLKDMEVPVITCPGIEADDILGTVSKKWESRGYEVSIVSGDRDLLQLVTEHIKLILPRTAKGETTISMFFPADVLREYKVEPLGIIELKALMGDSSDNIPGVPKIGEKTATELLEQYGNIDVLKEHIEEISKKSIRESLRDNFDLAVLSKALATIKTDADIDITPEEAEFKGLYTEKAFATIKELELRSLYPRFGNMAEEDRYSGLKEFTEEKDLGVVEDIFASALKADRVGMGVGIDETTGEVTSVAFKWEGKAVYISLNGFISPMYLKAHLNSLAEKAAGRIFTAGLKKQYSFVYDRYSEKLYDMEVMEYLLDPLRNNYDIPEDIRLAAALSYNRGEAVLSEVRENGMEDLLIKVEMPLTYTLALMEKEGIRVQAGELERYSKELGEKIKLLEGGIYQSAGEEFNINSPKQLGQILFEKMGIEGGKKTKTGYSTSAEVLEKLSPEYPFVRDILKYRTYAKLKATYADGLQPFIREDGRIHSTFNQTVTATGRISSADPNLQNIPVRTEEGRAFRRVFIPKDGYSFIDADYSQIELRILASLSGDKKLIEAYNEGKDIHAITASQVFNVPIDEVTPELRRNAKAVNFGIVYGISSFGLSQDLSISRTEAKEYIDRYFMTYPDVKNYLDSLIDFAKKNGYALTYFGRKRPVPELKSPIFAQRSFGERVAMNAPIQGTAADIIKIAMSNVIRALREDELKSALILQIHDELLIETAPGEEDRVKEILNREMTGAVSLPVPLIADINSGSNWDEAH